MLTEPVPYPACDITTGGITYTNNTIAEPTSYPACNITTGAITYNATIVDPTPHDI